MSADKVKSVESTPVVAIKKNLAELMNAEFKTKSGRTVKSFYRFAVLTMGILDILASKKSFERINQVLFQKRESTNCAELSAYLASGKIPASVVLVHSIKDTGDYEITVESLRDLCDSVTIAQKAVKACYLVYHPDSKSVAPATEEVADTEAFFAPAVLTEVAPAEST